YLARATGASLFLLRVIEPSLPHVGAYPYNWQPQDLLEEGETRAETEAYDYLSRLILTEHLDTLHHQAEFEWDWSPGVHCQPSLRVLSRADLAGDGESPALGDETSGSRMHGTASLASSPASVTSVPDHSVLQLSGSLRDRAGLLPERP